MGETNQTTTTQEWKFDIVQRLWKEYQDEAWYSYSLGIHHRVVEKWTFCTAKTNRNDQLNESTRWRPKNPNPNIWSYYYEDNHQWGIKHKFISIIHLDTIGWTRILTNSLYNLFGRSIWNWVLRDTPRYVSYDWESNCKARLCFSENGD